MDTNYVISDDIIELFRVRYDFDLSGYIDDYFYFVLYQYPQIVNFYIGNVEKSEEHFVALANLLQKSDDLDTLLRESRGDFTTYEHWQFFDYITDMREKLLVFNRIYKFVRSSKTETNYSSEFKYDYNISQGENLENISRNKLGNNNPHNDWQDIARANQLYEIDYSSKSGNQLLLSIRLNAEALGIRSVIDSVEGKKVLGLDLDRNVAFIDDDLKVWDYDKTYEQCVQILLDLTKGSVPEFPTFGRVNTAGQSLNVFNLGNIIRELTETISSDDSIIDFTILGIENDYNNNLIHVKCGFRSRMGYINMNKNILV